MNFGSLFTGIGGFDLGFERAGMHCAWQVEIDDRCNQVLAHHWPNVKRYGDVRDVGRRNLEPVDLVCGGFPCQDVSVAGRREGLDGERSGLWFEFLRVVEELKPRWIIVENVPGLLSSNERRDFATVLSGLAECGYMGAYRVLDAQYFGVPQRRRRVFVVGCLGDWASPAEVLFERKSSPWDSAPRREAGAGDAQAVAGRLGGGGPDDNKAQGGFYIAGHCTGQGWWNQDNIAGTLRAEGENRPSRPSNVIAFGGNNTSGDPFIAPTLTAPDPNAPKRDGKRQDGSGTDRIPITLAVSENQRAELRLTPYSRQLTGGGGKPGQGYPCVVRTGLVRRLMPLECERLQGFPDHFTAIDGMSDSVRYRMLGNAVTVPVAEWLGKRLVLA